MKLKKKNLKGNRKKNHNSNNNHKHKNNHHNLNKRKEAYLKKMLKNYKMIYNK